MSEVYFLRPVGQDGPVKIGCSTYPEGRLQSYCAWSPVPLEIVARIPGDQTVERRFHALFYDLHTQGEWFAADVRLKNVLAAVVAGDFDVKTLPAPRRLKNRTCGDRFAAARAGANNRRVSKMIYRDEIDVPEIVQEAAHTYQSNPEEKARRRKIVAAFLAAYDRISGERPARSPRSKAA